MRITEFNNETDTEITIVSDGDIRSVEHAIDEMVRHQFMTRISLTMHIATNEFKTRINYKYTSKRKGVNIVTVTDHFCETETDYVLQTAVAAVRRLPADTK